MTSLRERVSELYFRPKGVEFDGRIYEWLAVVRFKQLLMKLVKADSSTPTPNAYVLGGRGLEKLLAFEGRTRRSEAIHLLGLIFSFVLLALAASRRAWGPGVAGIVVFVANFPCFILQRYNRIRLLRVLDRERNRSIRPGSAAS